MAKKDELTDKLKYLNDKVEWSNKVADDAAEHKFFDVAKYLRNTAQLAKSQIYGIEQAIKSFQ